MMNDYYGRFFNRELETFEAVFGTIIIEPSIKTALKLAIKIANKDGYTDIIIEGKKSYAMAHKLPCGRWKTDVVE